jgi:phosphoglucosamine mutase
MESRDFVLGGEQSGHIVFGDLATTGDGILTGIQALDAARRVGQPLGELSAAIFERVPQVIVNVPVVRPVIEVATEVADDVTAVAVALGDEGRVLVRPSGTEPLVRVMVEALDENLANAMADRLCEIVRRSDQEPTGGADNS